MCCGSLSLCSWLDWSAVEIVLRRLHEVVVVVVLLAKLFQSEEQRDQSSGVSASKAEESFQRSPGHCLVNESALGS